MMDIETENDLVRFEIVSDGRSGQEWADCLEKKGIGVETARSFLLSKDFIPTQGVTYKVVVFMTTKENVGGLGFSKRFFNPSKVEEEAMQNHWKIPPMEIACLILDCFSVEDLKKFGFFQICIPGREFYGQCLYISIGYPVVYGRLLEEYKASLSKGCLREERLPCGRGFVFVE